MLINIDANVTYAVNVTGAATVMPRNRWLLTAPTLRSRSMQLNGVTLALDAQQHLPSMQPEVEVSTAPEQVPPYSIVFMELPHANHPGC